MSGWILSNKRKPRSGREVLVYCPKRTWGRTVTGIYWNKKDSGGSPGWKVGDDGYAFRDDVTHWRPLPQEP